MMRRTYGDAPVVVGQSSLDWEEYMHYMYLPISMEGSEIRLPQRLETLRPLIDACMEEEFEQTGAGYEYIYLCARRGFATPGNPLNRPGWHADGFGTDDVNYIWTDRFPTLFAVQKFPEISTDHVESMEQFNTYIDPFGITEYPDCTLLRLDPFVVHAAPEIPAPGGERGFIKVSFSNEKYNLRGNSHNYLFDYDWRMWTRDEIRNDPAFAGKDSGPV